MVIRLAVQSLNLKAMAAIGLAHGDDVLTEHMAVGLHVERL